MKCPNCGNENPPDYLFCDECGARLIGNDIAAATGDSGDLQPQDGMSADAGGGGGGGGVTPYNSDSTPSNVDSPIATYGDYNVGMGLGTGDTVAEGMEQAADQADPADASASGAPAASVPVTEDTVDTDQADDQDADDGIKPLQSMVEDVDSAMADTTSEDTEAYQDAEAAVSGVADDARNAVDDNVGSIEGNVWTGSVPSVAHDWSATMPSATADRADEAASTPAVDADEGAAPAGNDWASHALSLLDKAQGALAGGDWGTFGNSLNDLRAALQNVAGGVAGTFAQPQAGATSDTSTQAPTADPGSAMSAGDVKDNASAGSTWGGSEDTSSAPAVDYSAATPASEVSQYDPFTPAPMSAPPQASDQGMGAGMGASPDQGYMGMGESAQPADTTASASMMDSGAGAVDQDDTVPPAIQPIASISTNSGPMPSATSVGTGARLILISSGAEMALPDQEEITVGREDPSSGIFPDVDLTPHGGEDGGVSRRHARLLHVGDDYFVEDLQSTNFTKLDGQRLPAHVRERLDDGARLDFGRVAMIFRRG